jgi:drug/metabolite transporter (DMT)-like permease
MISLLIYLIIYCATSSFSIALLGDRNLISGNLWSIEKIISILFHWKFISAMVLAVVARLSFTLMNGSVLAIPHLAKNATTITTFVAASSYIFIIAVNFFMLDEKMDLQQFIGAGLIMLGITVMLK